MREWELTKHPSWTPPGNKASMKPFCPREDSNMPLQLVISNWKKKKGQNGLSSTKYETVVTFSGWLRLTTWNPGHSSHLRDPSTKSGCEPIGRAENIKFVLLNYDLKLEHKTKNLMVLRRQ